MWYLGVVCGLAWYSVTGCAPSEADRASGGLRMLGENTGFGMGLPLLPDGGPVSVGTIMLCADNEGAPVDITGVRFARADGVQIEDYRVRPNPFEGPQTPEKYSLGAEKRTLDQAGFGAGHEVSAVCGQSSVEMGIQFARSLPVATGKDLEVEYVTATGEQGVLTVRFYVALCGPGVSAHRCSDTAAAL